jgi:hypothetical protein
MKVWDNWKPQDRQRPHEKNSFSRAENFGTNADAYRHVLRLPDGAAVAKHVHGKCGSVSPQRVPKANFGGENCHRSLLLNR